MKEKEIRQKIEKIVVGSGVGKLSQNPNFTDKILPEIKKEISLITGQIPSERKAKKSIAGFKSREGDVVGLQVTLRGKYMVDFFNRLVHIVLPRLRDFRGIDLGKVDHSGSLNIGFRDRQSFSEIDLDNSNVEFGLQVTIVPFEKDRDNAIDFYRSFGVPLKKPEGADVK